MIDFGAVWVGKAAEKLGIPSGFEGKRPQGAEAHVGFVAFAARLSRALTLLAARDEFSRSPQRSR